MASPPTFDDPTLPQLDPQLERLGELIGLLDSDGDSGHYKLHTAWFSNPIDPIKEIATKRRKELLGLIVSFLGEPETSLLADGDAQKWYPIEFPDKNGEANPTGLYLVTDADASETSLPIRLGAQFDLNVGPISAQLQLQLPLVDLASGKFPLASGSEPVVLGLQLGLAEGQKFGTENITLSGLKLTAKLSLKDAPVIDLVLSQFSIAGSAPKDLSLAELAKDPSKLVGAALNAAVVAALELATKAAIDHKADEQIAKAILADLLWVLGLNGDKDSEVPAIQWTSLSDWFDSILKDPAKLKAWLHGFYCLVKGFDVTARKGDRGKDIPGDGTVANPFGLSIVADKNGDRILDGTFAVDTTSGVKILPGLRLTSPAIRPSDDIDIRVEANAQLGGIGDSLRPQFKLAAIVVENKGDALFTYSGETADDAISPNRFETGIRFALEDGKPKLTPFADLEQSASQGHDAKTTSLIDLWQQANPLDDPIGWLLDRLKDEELWDQVMTRLLPEDSGLAWLDGGIEYAYTSDDGASSLQLRAALAGASGVAVTFDARSAVEWVNLALKGSLTLADVTNPSAPAVNISASLGGAPTDKLVPRFTAGYGADGFQLALEMPLDEQPIRLSLVPFRGVEGFSIDKVWTILESGVLDNASAKKWMESAFSQSAAQCTPATVLTRWGLLTQLDGKYRFPRTGGAIDVAAIQALRPEKLILTALSQFLASVEELELFKIGKDDALFFTQDKSSSTYGVRFTLPDISFGGGSDDKNPDKPAGTKLTLKAGKGMSGEKDVSWLTRSWGNNGTPPKPGIQIDMVRAKNGSIDFAPALKLVSVGFDATGTAKSPLFNIKSYRAEGVELRLYLDASGSGVKVGGGAQLDSASIPLGPSAGPDAGTKNPVAAGLLSSGADSASDDKGTDPVNPEFGLQISYIHQFDARILSDDPLAGGKIWIPVGKSFGPLLCRKVGLGFNTDEFRLLVGYDGSVALGPLGINLIDLTVGIPLKAPQNFSDYSLGLSGLDLSFRGGPVSISGSFLESEANGITQYTGAAMIRTDAFSIAGLGSYASLNGTPSLFVFAVLNKDLGGPAFFFVTALAAGFGFKRKLILPAITEVQNFPLVRVIQEPDYIGKSADPKDALAKISTAIPPDPASYWLAVGVRFRSFGLIETVALLSATFGSEFTLSILGLSKLTIPSNIQEGKTAICYAELALRAEFNPAVGVLSVEARLTPNSYIFDKSCRLTGGFAFYTWFSGPHSGDFVVTLGGYHPSFVPPDHYPLVPRVAIDWRVSGSIRVTGELYFALTPSCLMAGGKLSAVYDGGWVKAWFIAYADFLVAWKPFHYDIQIGVSLGASATVSIDLGLFSISLTVSFELGVDLHVYGPDFSGTARIKFYVVSFTIRFGGDPVLPQPIPWDEFKQSFLPEDNAVCGVNFTGGLMQEWKKDDGTKVAIVNAHEFAFTAQSQTPLTEIGWNDSKPQPQLLKVNQGQLGIAPMYAGGLDSKLDVSIVTPDGATLDSALFTSSVVTKGFPKALWGAGKPDLTRPSSDVLTQIPAGLSVALSEQGKQSQVKHSLPPMLLEYFNYELINKQIPWGNGTAPDTIKDYTQSIDTLSSTIWANDAVSKTRAAILSALADITPYPLNTVALPLTALQAPTIFQSEPRIAALGELPREDR